MTKGVSLRRREGFGVSSSKEFASQKLSVSDGEVKLDDSKRRTNGRDPNTARFSCLIVAILACFVLLPAVHAHAPCFWEMTICTTVAGGTACASSGSPAAATAVIVLGAVIGLVFGVIQFMKVKSIQLPQTTEETGPLIEQSNRVRADSHEGGIDAFANPGKQPSQQPQ